MFLPVPVKGNAKLIDQVVALMRTRAQIGNERLTERQTELAVQKFHESMDLKSVNHMACVRDGMLAAYMTQVISSVSPNYWMMSFLMTNPELQADWNYKRNGLDVLWRAAFSFGKQYNRHGVVWSLPKSWSQTFVRTQRASPLWQQYTIDSYDEIPAGALPLNEFDQWVFGERVKPYDVVLRSAFPTKKLQPDAPARIWLPVEATPSSDPI